MAPLDSVSEVKHSSWSARYDRVMAWLKRPLGLAILAGLLATGIAGDYIYFAYFAKTNPFFILEDPHSLSAGLAKIHPGSTRETVEQILTERAPRQPPPGKTRYKLGDRLIVEVSFDATGGAGRPSNKVTGPIGLMIGLPAKISPKAL